MNRSLSYSEISTAMTCQARHAFGYTGHLTGGQTLHRRSIAPNLSAGRAWGAAVAAWHGFPDDRSLMGAYQPTLARFAAHEALRASYRNDLKEQQELGVWVDPELQVRRENWLMGIADHYMSTADRLANLTRLEGEIDAPIPSRTGRQASSRYRFTGFLDGFTEQGNGQWIVEFKLRTQLTEPAQIQLSRQIRWYAFARQIETGQSVTGCLVDERLAEAPKPARLVQAKSKRDPHQDEFGRIPSHAKDQMCTADAYISLCIEYDVEPHPDVILALRSRSWQYRHPIIFRPSELKEAGQELVSAAKFIQQLDSGELWPVRNAAPHLCRGCKFREACPDPDDLLYLDTIFERRVPKRLREPEQAPPASNAPPEGPGHLTERAVSVAPAQAPAFAYAESEEVPWAWT